MSIHENQGRDDEKVIYLNTGPRKTEYDTEKAAGEDTNSFPGCLFCSCFANDHGHCTLLEDNDFNDERCPFYKTKERAKNDWQDSLDHLLLTGRLDLINRYEQTYIEMGILKPETPESDLDDEILKARAEIAEFIAGLEDEKTTDTEADTTEFDLEGLMDEEKDNGLQ